MRRLERVRLCLPPGLPAPLGHDAVGVAAPLGPRISRSLPRTGCVFADAERWWWIVPGQADTGLVWPDAADYAAGAVLSRGRAAGGGPRLAYWPKDNVPYTHPIMLYIVLCNALGRRPEWREAPRAEAPGAEAPGPVHALHRPVPDGRGGGAAGRTGARERPWSSAARPPEPGSRGPG
ncbi:hypothetical protein [Streptomyces aidingensis]|uniref:hypothetical protein n=1 Tax=Streptomyces aidingensis TaxID=910347 RepID=UPI000B81CECF|nr:hypothetical protein [Streptomyces aidingensis]